MFRGDRLKKLRKDKGLTQEDLGKEIGVTKSSICFYEKGSRTPSLENIADFIGIFGVTADYFLGTDHHIKTIDDNHKEHFLSMTKEELIFIEELKKDKTVYDILLDDPKRGAELVKKKIG